MRALSELGINLSKLKASLVFIVASCCVISSAMAKQSNGLTEVISKSDTLFSNAVSSDTVPGISVAVADNRGVVWASSYGLADIENQVEMTPRHKMRIGSVAKLITVAAMMRMSEKSQLDIDIPITQYVESWPKTHLPITLRQLASHTSGIRHYKNSAEFLLNQHYSNVESSLTLFKDDSLLFEPGIKTSYSTYAFSLISAAMEGAIKQHKQSIPPEFKQLIETEVFLPLQMNQSVFDDSSPIIPFRQRPYIARDGKIYNAVQTDHSNKYAGGGFIATPSDISRFAVAHTQSSYLKQNTVEEMFTPARLSDGSKTAYGIGWMIGFDNHKDRSYYKNRKDVQNMMASIPNAVMHSGGSNGGTTMMIMCLDHNRAITVVKNVHGEHTADVFLLALETLQNFHSLN